MIEAGAVIDIEGKVIFWHLPPGRSGGSLPDSRTLWEVNWHSFKEGRLLGFAHSHPGSGVPGPSYTDVTTFSAIEAALGTRLLWWITSSDHVVLSRWCGDRVTRALLDGNEVCNVGPTHRFTYSTTIVTEALSWVPELRRLSEEQRP